MNTQAIRDLLQKQPFEPFAVIMSSGERHEIRHPEMALLSATRLVVLDAIEDRLAILSLVHVSELRMLQPSPAGT